MKFRITIFEKETYPNPENEAIFQSIEENFIPLLELKCGKIFEIALNENQIDNPYDKIDHLCKNFLVHPELETYQIDSL